MSESTVQERDPFFADPDRPGANGIRFVSANLVPGSPQDSSAHSDFLSAAEIEALYYVRKRRSDVRRFTHLRNGLHSLEIRGAIIDFGDAFEMTDAGKQLYEMCMDEEAVPERWPE